MTDSRVVVVNSATATSATKAGDYRTTLIIDTHFDTLSRVRVFAPGEETEITAGTPLRNALTAAFSTNTKPALVRVAKAKGTATYTPVGVAEGNEYGFSITVNDAGTETTQNETYTVLAAGDAQDVCDALKTQFDLVTAITDVVTLTVVGTGDDAVLQISLDDNTDDFAITTFTGNYTLTGVASETPVDTLDDVVTYTNEFSFVCATSHVPSYQAALAAAIGSYEEKKYFTSTQLATGYEDWDGESVPNANDVPAVFRFNNYQRAHCHYNHQADTLFPELRMISTFTRLEPGRQNWQYASLPGVALAQRADLSRPLTTSDQLNLKATYASTDISLGGVTVSGGYEGSGNRMADGTRIEVLWWTDRASQKIKQLWETLLLRNDKLGMNDFDIPKFRNVADTWLRNEASAAGRTAALDPDNPPKIVMPTPSEIEFADKVSGTLRNIEVTAYYDASIDNVISNLTVTFFDPATEG